MTHEELKKLIKSKVIPALRRVSRWWPEKNIAKRNAKVSPGKYKCASCNELVKEREYQLDHVKPIVDPKVGFVDYNTFIERLLCGADNYQLLCIACHELKTSLENELRKKYKKRKKKLDK